MLYSPRRHSIAGPCYRLAAPDRAAGSGRVERGAADLGDLEDAEPLRRVLDREDERAKHLSERDQAEPPRAVARRREPLEEPVAGQEQERPPVPGAQHVPGPEDGRREPARPERVLALRA